MVSAHFVVPDVKFPPRRRQMLPNVNLDVVCINAMIEYNSQSVGLGHLDLEQLRVAAAGEGAGMGVAE